jgi:hypothetical protein
MPRDEKRMIEDRFLLRERIGDGRMSTVHLASDAAFNDRTVAVKILNTKHPDKVKRALFERETSALKKLHHTNIVKLLHSGWSAGEGAFYIVLDYLPYSLDRYLAGDYGPSMRIEPYRAMRELADALAHAHSENVIHRDIKPSNVLLTDSGRPLLTDFGISKLRTQLTVGETLAGFWSSGYASPEQRLGKPASTHSDVYSLGATFVHMLTRTEPPPEGPDPHIVDDHIRYPPPIKKVLKKMLATDPNARFPRGADLLTALDVTRRHEPLPRHYLVLTRSARRDLRAAGHCTGDEFQDAADAVVEDLGGMEVDEIHVNREQGDDRGMILLGGSLRLVCTRNEEQDALIVKAIQTPYSPHLDLVKTRSMAYRAMWMPVDGTVKGDRSPTGTANALRQLWIAMREFCFSEAIVCENERFVWRDDVDGSDCALREVEGEGGLCGEVFERRSACLSCAGKEQGGVLREEWAYDRIAGDRRGGQVHPTTVSEVRRVNGVRRLRQGGANGGSWSSRWLVAYGGHMRGGWERRGLRQCKRQAEGGVAGHPQCAARTPMPGSPYFTRQAVPGARRWRPAGGRGSPAGRPPRVSDGA